jgi:hypothetical protein
MTDAPSALVTLARSERQRARHDRRRGLPAHETEVAAFQAVSGEGDGTMKCSTCAEVRVRMDQRIAAETIPEHRRMLELWRDHWWGEVVYDIDAIMATVTPEISYRWHGTAAFGPGIVIDSEAAAREMYLAQFAAGLMPGAPFDAERIALGSWGMAWDARFTMAFPGSAVAVPGATLAPDRLYLMQLDMAVFHPFDRETGKMAGEIMYAGAPFNIEPTDRATIAHLLGWDPATWRR